MVIDRRIALLAGIDIIARPPVISGAWLLVAPSATLESLPAMRLPSAVRMTCQIPSTT